MFVVKHLPLLMLLLPGCAGLAESSAEDAVKVIVAMVALVEALRRGVVAHHQMKRGPSREKPRVDDHEARLRALEGRAGG